jgi:uncharacterized phage infection (PIP) family protein YhgE
LISDSVEKVEAGTRLVDQAGATMHDIVESVTRVTDIMAEITAASREQTAGIEQIHQAVSQMDQVTQQNATLVEEAAAAAESLQNRAINLTNAVNIFKLENMPRIAEINAYTGGANNIIVLPTRVKPIPKVMSAKQARSRSETRRFTNAKTDAIDYWAQI